MDQEAKDVYMILNNIDKEIQNKTIEIFNKVDLYDFDKNFSNLDNSQIFVSSTKGIGLEKISIEIQKILEKNYSKINLTLNRNTGFVLNWLYENSKVIEKKVNEYGEYKVLINISRVNLERMKSKFSDSIVLN